mmetsp:Transcript_86822/g.246129  ORF Transcript_86822/g.246129 Transcript_86822/m.246129 type:complete len:275 (+) Transcript_86822:969-1793(+)
MDHVAAAAAGNHACNSDSGKLRDGDDHGPPAAECKRECAYSGTCSEKDCCTACPGSEKVKIIRCGQCGGRVEGKEPNKQEEYAKQGLNRTVDICNLLEDALLDFRLGPPVVPVAVALPADPPPAPAPRPVLREAADARARDACAHESTDSTNCVNNGPTSKVYVPHLLDPSASPAPSNDYRVDDASHHSRQDDVGHKGHAPCQRPTVDCGGRCGVRELEKPLRPVEPFRLHGSCLLPEGNLVTEEVECETADKKVHHVLHHDVGGVNGAHKRSL